MKATVMKATVALVVLVVVVMMMRRNPQPQPIIVDPAHQKRLRLAATPIARVSGDTAAFRATVRRASSLAPMLPSPVLPTLTEI